MTKIVFVNRYFYPDHSATSQLLSDLAFFLASQGVQVEIIASRQSYTDPGAQLPGHEIINGVKVCRVWTSRFGRGHLVGRAVDYITFYLSAFVRLFRDVRKGDTIVAKTDPPLISAVAATVARFRGAVLVNWVQDLFPEVAVSLGVRIPSPIEKIVKKVRNWSLHAAKINVVLGERMADSLVKTGVPSGQISIIHNWSSEHDIRPLQSIDNPLREQWGLNGKFVVGYSGNMGRAHEFDTVLDAAQLLVDDPHIIFLFIGDGAQKVYVQERAAACGLTNVLFKPYQPREKLALSLSVPDVHLISLLPELEGMIVPSKFYGIAAAGRPAIFIGDPEGEIPKILREYGCGDSVEIGSSRRLCEIIYSHVSQGGAVHNMGERAREVFESHFTTSHALIKWAGVLGVLVRT